MHTFRAYIRRLREPLNFYLFVLVCAGMFGWFGRFQLAFLSDYTTVTLAGIIFFSALKIPLKEVTAVGRHPRTIILFNIAKLVLLPIAIYIPALVLCPPLALPLLVLATVPSAMSSPLFADIIGGRPSLAVVATLTSSLLAPITIPLVIKTLAGVSVHVPFWPMALSIAEVIVVPLSFAWVVRHSVPRMVERSEPYLGHASILMLGLLTTGVLAKQSQVALSHFSLLTLGWYLLVTSGMMLVFYVAGFGFSAHTTFKDRITLTVGISNMNFTLALYLVTTYFPSPENVILITVSIIPWFVMIIIFKLLLQKHWLRAPH